MVLLAPILACVGLFIAFTSLFQFCNVLAQGEPNPHLARSGRDLSRYAAAIVDFLTYNSEQRPFPFAAPPEDQPSGGTPSRTAPTQPSRATTRKKKTASRKKTGTSTSTRQTSTKRRSTTRKSTSRTIQKETSPTPVQPPKDTGERSE